MRMNVSMGPEGTVDHYFFMVVQMDLNERRRAHILERNHLIKEYIWSHGDAKMHYLNVGIFELQWGQKPFDEFIAPGRYFLTRDVIDGKHFHPILQQNATGIEILLCASDSKTTTFHKRHHVLLSPPVRKMDLTV